MSSAAECRPFCRRANEIRYQYVYQRQKLGLYIYIYIYIRLSVYIKQGGGGGGAVTMTTPRHHRFCHNDTVPQATTESSHRQTSPQCAIHSSNINHSKAVHIWHEHVGPGHDLIKDLNSCSECAVFMFMGSMFHTCAP